MLGVAGFVALAVGVWAVVASILPTEGMKKSTFQEECVAGVKDDLRDPGSVELEPSDSGVIYTEEKDQFSLLGTGRARNGFGGMNSFIFGCTGTFDEETEEFNVSADIMEN